MENKTFSQIKDLFKHAKKLTCTYYDMENYDKLSQDVFKGNTFDYEEAVTFINISDLEYDEYTAFLTGNERIRIDGMDTSYFFDDDDEYSYTLEESKHTFFTEYGYKFEIEL